MATLNLDPYCVIRYRVLQNLKFFHYPAFISNSHYYTCHRVILDFVEYNVLLTKISN